MHLSENDAVLISVCEPLNYIHQDTKSARLIAVCRRSTRNTCTQQPLARLPNLFSVMLSLHTAINRADFYGGPQRQRKIYFQPQFILLISCAIVSSAQIYFHHRRISSTTEIFFQPKFFSAEI